MLNKELERRYGVLGVWDTISFTDCLFSCTVNDPVIMAEELIFHLKAIYYDIVVTISANGKCIVKVVQFRTKMGYDRYVYDKVNIFE
jgi:hypothetical protein